MAAEGVPLDEIQWEMPAAVQYYGGIRADNIHLYFLNSPFCDPSSNNAVLNLQAGRNPALFPILQDRRMFEERLSTLRGVEYVVVEGPKENIPGMNPLWIIRKRNRERAGPGEPDELTTLGTYYCVGTRIYQAPSLGDVVASKLAHTAQLMSQFFNTASSMQFYTPATGHSYVPPVQQRSSAKTPGLASAQTSRAGTPAPGASQILPTQSQSQLSSKSTTTTSQLATSAQDDRDLFNSLNMTLMYGDEYMDENELIGEPGSFHFSATQSHIRSQQEKDKKMQQASQSSARSTAGGGSSRGASVAPTPAPSLPQVKTEGLNGGKKAKVVSPVSAGSGNGMKPKRRKSRMSNDVGAGGTD